MRSCRCRLVPAIILLLCTTALAQSDSLSPGQRRIQRGFHDRVGWHLVNGAWVRASGQCEWKELLRLRWAGQQLAVDALPIDRAAGLLRGGRTVAVEIGAARDLYQLVAREIPLGGGVPLLREPILLRPGELALYIAASEMRQDDLAQHSPRQREPEAKQPVQRANEESGQLGLPE